MLDNKFCPTYNHFVKKDRLHKAPSLSVRPLERDTTFTQHIYSL